MGSSTILYLNTGNRLIVMEVSGSLQAQVGDQLPLLFPAEHLYLFDQESDKTLLFPDVSAANGKILK
jgi:ABC-type sugar transport system ATPase subunit